MPSSSPLVFFISFLRVRGGCRKKTTRTFDDDTHRRTQTRPHPDHPTSKPRADRPPTDPTPPHTRKAHPALEHMQTDRETERQRDRETERQRDRKTEGRRSREKKRQRGEEIETHVIFFAYGFVAYWLVTHRFEAY